VTENGTLNIVQGFSKYGDKTLRSQRIEVMLFFDAKSMVLKNILINKAEKTVDILGQASEEQRAQYHQLKE